MNTPEDACFKPNRSITDHLPSGPTPKTSSTARGNFNKALEIAYDPIELEEAVGNLEDSFFFFQKSLGRALPAALFRLQPRRA